MIRMIGSLDDVLENVLSHKELQMEDVEYLLSLRDEASVKRLFETAREVRDRSLGARVFLSGFIYFSTHCKNNCSFCFYRRSNDSSPRYRKSKEEILSLAASLQDARVHMVDLTMGEDPDIYKEKDFETLQDLVRSVDETVDLPIMVSPGALPERMFAPLRDDGMDWFACYQETHNRDLFKRLRPDQDYDTRLNQKIWARQAGVLTEEGIMIGVGESIADRALSILTMHELKVREVRAMSFVPQFNTPMEWVRPTTSVDELVTIAVMRLVHPDKMIPASLDIEGSKGLRPRLDAGANLITSIVPPRMGLAGVAQHELDIDNGERSVENIETMLDEMNIKVGTLSEFNEMIDDWKQQIGRERVAQ
jgi:methylornithine synthase